MTTTGKGSMAIDLTLVEAKTGAGAAGVLVSIHLEALHKNNYPLGFFLTDAHGAVRLDAAAVRAQVVSVLADAPMDYDPQWERCTHLIVEVPTLAALRKRLAILTGTYPDSAAVLGSQLQRARSVQRLSNRTYRCPIEKGVRITLG